MLLAEGGADPDDVGAVTFVATADYAAAVADPLADAEAALLGHLCTGHPAELARLAGLLPAELRGAGPALPVGLDRHGMVLRAGAVDVRLAFAEPVGCPHELPARMRELLARTGPGRRGGPDARAGAGLPDLTPR